MALSWAVTVPGIDHDSPACHGGESRSAAGAAGPPPGVTRGRAVTYDKRTVTAPLSTVRHESPSWMLASSLFKF